MQQLRGREGARVRRAYQLHSSRTGVKWQGRQYVPGQAFAAGDEVNRLLSALNASLYGVCHAAVVGLGASPGLGFIHTGNAISFVLDVADLYKAVTTIPAAFDLAADGAVSERDARLHFRDIVVREKLMQRVVHDVRWLLLGEREPTAAGDFEEEEPPSNMLAGDTAEAVPGGRNYGETCHEFDPDWLV